MATWYFQPVLDSYLVVGLVSLALVALLGLRPVFGKLTTKRRRILIGLRVAIVVLIVLAMLRPTFVFTSAARQFASLIILFDSSRSMDLPSAASDKTRWESQQEALRAAQPALVELAEQFNVKIYGYDQQLHSVNFQRGRLELPADPGGNLTDIGSSLDTAIRNELGRPLAAVVVLGDGVQTAFDPKVEIHEAGRELGRMGTPLYAVAFGRSGDEAESRDVSVDNLPEQLTVFVKNRLELRGVVRVRGYTNQEIPVELELEAADGTKQIVATRSVTARSDNQQLSVDMAFTPEMAGQFKLTFRVPERPGELVTKNNSLTAYLTVREGGLKVVYAYGSLVGEQRYLRWALDASPDIDLRHIFLDPRNRERWPDDRSELLRDPEVDVFILENVDASAFRPEDLAALAEVIASGRGLLMIGGYHSFGPGSYHRTPLKDVLPIEMSRFERQSSDPLSPINVDLHLEPEEGLPMRPVRPHPITRLASDEENQELWQRLPPLAGANRLRSVKDTAQILAESPGGDPLLIAGDYGRGRSLAFAGDSTFRWWQGGYQAAHKRFWRQVILWLAGREEDDRSDVWVKLPQRRFPPGMEVPFTAGANSAAGDPIADAELQVELITPDGDTREITVSRRDDEYDGTLRDLDPPGDYVLRVSARQANRVLGSTQALFQVLDRDLELANPAADPDQLARIAALTKDVDGRMIAAEQLPGLLRELAKKRPDERLQIEKRWRLADTWWDAWLYFLLLTGLLSTEWLCRKRWGLV